MGKKGGWFSAVKKALTTDSKDKNQLKNPKSKRLFAKEKDHQDCPPPSDEAPAAPPPANVDDKTNSNEVIENDLNNNTNACSETLPSAENEEEMVPETAFMKNMARYPGKSMEEIAAIRIQTVFRGFLARRELRALRRLERLKLLIEGQSVKRQSVTTLKCMQNLAHLQSQIRARRVRMSEENQALHRQLQQKHENELERLRMGKEWDVSMQSKEKIEANLQSKQEAAMRRERAMAYSFSHQTKKNSRSMNPSFMDPHNPHWGWSWLERWMASRPWDTRSASVMDNNDHSSLKSTVSRSATPAMEMKQKPKPMPVAQRPARPQNRQSLPTGPSLSTTPVRSSTKTGSSKNAKDDDTKSTMSTQPRPNRRHSIGEVSVRDDESLASSSPVPSYMTATKSTKGRSTQASPLRIVDNVRASEKGSGKKRLSFPMGAAPPVPETRGTRRHSHPGKIESKS